MKKQIIVYILALSLIFSQGSLVFADEELKLVDELDVIEEIKIEPTISLTLEQAYERMQNESPQAISAKFIYENEIQVGKGYVDNLRSLKKAAKDPDSWVDTSRKPQVELRVKFAKVQADKNYEAEQNKLKKDVYEKYYNHKYMEAQVDVAKDNYERTKKLKSDVMLKYNVGKISKLETLNVENALIEAEDAYKKAQSALESGKMAYNLFMGYNVKQTFVLTNKLEPFKFPEITIEETLEKALENRNELAAARHTAKLAREELKAVNYYPHNSVTYKKAKIAYDLSLLALKNTPANIEMDVRAKYSVMKQNYETLDIIKKKMENAKEVARLGQLRFDTGFIILNDLKEMQANIYHLEQAYYKAMLDYNLSVTDYNQCATVGLVNAEI